MAGAASESRGRSRCVETPKAPSLRTMVLSSVCLSLQSFVPEDAGSISNSSQCLLSWSTLASSVRKVDMKEIGGVMSGGRRGYSSLAPYYVPSAPALTGACLGLMGRYTVTKYNKPGKTQQNKKIKGRNLGPCPRSSKPRV